MKKVPVVVWFLVPSLIIAIIGVWIFSRGSNPVEQEEGPELPEAVSAVVEGTIEYEIVGQTHISTGAEASDYNSNPPTSGSHWSNPAENGVYDIQLPDEQLVHNLEHGHIWISYKSDISQEALNRLIEIAEDDDWKVVLSPREENDSLIAVAAWGRLLKMDEPDFQKIEDFIKTFRNRGPEKTHN
jgi:hypothetical protein